MRLLFALLATMVALLSAPPSSLAQSAPVAVAGVIDLRQWDFAAKGTANLSGQWAFKGFGQDGLLVQPGPWNRMRPDLPAAGQLVLSLTVLLPPGAPPLALSVPDVNSAATVQVDGVVVRTIGRVAETHDGEIPVLERALVPLPQQAGKVELAITMSNFHHFEGGMVRAARIGPRAALESESLRLKVVPLMALGAMVMVMALMPTFWLGGKREPVFLVLGAFTGLLAWRTFASGQLYTLLGSDLRSDIWYLPAAYISMYVFPGIYLGFLRSLFPDETPRWLAWPVYAASGVMAALVLLAPPDIYTRFRDAFQLMILLVPLVGAVLLVRAVLRRRPGAGWVLAGSLMMTAAVVNDSLHYMRVINTTDLVPLGFASYAVAYCAALALRLFKSERAASERLAALNRALEDKVAERTRSLAEAKAAAEQASVAKSEFLAVMSHEIRTPLHGWAGLTQLLENTSLDEGQRHYVALLRRTAEHLTQLIGDILDMSRIEAGRMELTNEPFRLADLVQELSELGQARVSEKGLDFVVTVAPALPAALVGDSGAIRQIILNFIGNAAKFTRTGSITLAIGQGERGLRFSVTDTGCGIPADRLGDIFEVFTQVDGSSRRPHGGSGLGLAICRRLAELMGGRVGVTSELGVGTTVWCELPLPEAAEPVAAAQPAPTRWLPPGLKVLFADDVELNRLVMREFLNGTGAEVDEAVDGAEVLAKIEAGQYDLAVLDLRMPGMDGFQAARAIRERERRLGLEPLPLAALSAGAAPSDRRLAEQAGFTTFLTKPISRPALIAALADMVPQTREVPDLPPPPDIPEGLADMLPMFVKEMEKDAAILQGSAEGPLQELAEHAHAMRGKCAMFGEETLFELLTRIEHLAMAGGGGEIPVLIGQAVERAGQLRSYQTQT